MPLDNTKHPRPIAMYCTPMFKTVASAYALEIGHIRRRANRGRLSPTNSLSPCRQKSQNMRLSKGKGTASFDMCRRFPQVNRHCQRRHGLQENSMQRSCCSAVNTAFYMFWHCTRWSPCSPGPRSSSEPTTFMSCWWVWPNVLRSTRCSA